jgi:PEGA domain
VSVRALALSCLLLAACAGTQKPKGPPAELRVVAEPESATVQVNERFVGAARVLDKRPAKLTPGLKHVTVEAPGYFPHDFDADLPAGVTTVKIKLRPVPP